MVASSASKVIVMIPGAWHGPEHYQNFRDRLEAKGHKVVVQRSPSCDSKEPEKQTIEVDVAFIRDNLLLPVINGGEDVVLVMHSYGGATGAAAAVGLSKAERTQEGKEGGIIGLVFICAFVANEGDSLLSKLPNQEWEPWHNIHDGGQVSPDTPKQIFYADVPSPLDIQAISALRLQSLTSFTTKSPPPAWPLAVYNGRRSYLQCTEDRAIPLIAQQMMLQYSGVEWNMTQMESSHSPFLSHPQETVDWVEAQINVFDANM